MNGHSEGETLTFRILEIGRQLRQNLGDESDAPIFILAAGLGSGEQALTECLEGVDERDLLAVRTADLAARFGYSLERCGCVETPSTVITVPAPAVHSNGPKNRCAVLVPAIRYIEPECEEALCELERRGYTIKRVRGCSPVDHARSVLATAAIEAEFDETLWIDADTAFSIEAVDRLRSHDLPIVAGVYARRGPLCGLAIAPLPGTGEITMGDAGGLVEVLYAGAGFLRVRREVYESIRGRFSLPLCDEHSSSRAVPFFMPMLEDWGGRMTYLGEDYAFCRRARLCGYKIMVDTSIRLWHIGPYKYGYEDAMREIERGANYRHVFGVEKNFR